jgi:hypothetical protein
MDANNTEWRAGDNEGKTWCAFRWCDGSVLYLQNESGRRKAFRSRKAAQAAADALNTDLVTLATALD